MTTALNFPQFRFGKPELDTLYNQGKIGPSRYMALAGNGFRTDPSQQSDLAQRLMDSIQSQNAKMASMANYGSGIMRNTNMMPPGQFHRLDPRNQSMNITPVANTATTQAQPMAQGQGPSFRFQDLNRAFQLDPRNTLANTLMQQGARGTPIRTPLEGIGRLSQSLVGAMLQKRALDRLEGQETTRQENLTTALQNLNLQNNPALAALANIDPMAALTAGVAQEAALQQIGAKAQLEKTTNLTTEVANLLGLDTSRGQRYQQKANGDLILVNQGQAPKPLGTSFQALAGQEILKLYNLGDNRTVQQTQTMNFLNEQLKEPKIFTTTDQNNNPVTVRTPGFDALNFLQGGQTSATTDGLQKQDGQTATVNQSQQQDGQQTNLEVLGTKVQKLTQQEASYVSDYASAAADLQTVIDIMFKGDLYGGDYNKIVSVAAGNELGRAIAGSEAQILNDALLNLIDLRLRDRTGATANQEEVELYKNQVFPKITTRDDTQRDRIARLIREINSGFSEFSKGRDLGNIKQIKLPEKAKASQNNSINITLPGTG